jgi:hypothetical protein
LGIVPLVAAVPFAAAVSLRDGDAPARRPASTVFTPDEVKSLNAFQRVGVRHPYTCVRGRDQNHLDGEGVLLATEHGWICLYCEYTQDGASEFMKNWKWKEMSARELEGMRMERRIPAFGGNGKAFARGRRQNLL